MYLRMIYNKKKIKFFKIFLFLPKKNDIYHFLSSISEEKIGFKLIVSLKDVIFKTLLLESRSNDDVI